MVGIGGGSGSGKSCLASSLKNALGDQIAIVCMDWYYRDNGQLSDAEAKKLNFDHPDAIDMPLLLAQLDALMAGAIVHAPRYDYAAHARRRQTHIVHPAPIILLEGLLVLHDPRLLQRLYLSVYIDVPDDQRLIRRIRRDVERRHVGLEETLRLYEHCVRPMHNRFIHPSSANATWIWQQNEDKNFSRDLASHLRMVLRSKRKGAAPRPASGSLQARAPRPRR
jgi:uridine kinase